MTAGGGAISPPTAHVYIWADGVYLQARMEPTVECMLVIIGATPEGKKALPGFQVGVRESAQSWRELLVDLKARRLASIAFEPCTGRFDRLRDRLEPPELAVGDGALGFWKALEEVFPGARHQRCWMHKIANVLNNFPKSTHPAVTATCARSPAPRPAPRRWPPSRPSRRNAPSSTRAASPV